MEFNISVKNKNNVLNKIQLILSLVILLWLNVGTYTYIAKYISPFLKLSLYVFWIGLAVILNKKYIVEIIKVVFPLFIFIIIVKISSFFYIDNKNLDIYLKNFEYLLIISSISIYYLRNDQKNRIIILLILGFDYIYVGVNTIIQLNINPLLSRVLSSTSSIQKELLGESSFKAVGAYSYLYSMVMIILVLMDNVFNQKIYKRIITKVINIFIIAGLVILIFKAQFTISIVLTIIFSIKIILEIKFKNKKNLLYIILLIMLLITTLFLTALLEKVSQIEWLPSEIKFRICEINNAIQGNEERHTDLNSRIELYKKSINTFSHNIFIGSFGDPNIGGHSTFLDFLGLYGLMSIFFFHFYINMYKYTKNSINEEGKRILKNIWIYFFILSCINTVVFANFTVTLFVFVPFFILKQYGPRRNK